MTSPRIAELQGLWADLETTGAGAREFRATRVRSSAPIAVYAGLREPDAARSLIFEGPLLQAPRSRTAFAGEGISFSEGRSPLEDVYRLSATLEGAHFAGPFEALCADLLDVAEAGGGPSVALGVVVRRMSIWMVSLRRRSGLSDEAVRGLMGELHCLRTFAGVTDWAAAVDAWTGPDDGLHDITAGGGAWEVKTSSGAGASVWINGLDQLDGRGLVGLVLAHVHLASDTTGQSLIGLSRELRTEIAGQAPGALSEFERKLVAAGFLGAEPAAEAAYRITSTTFYAVTNETPRILRDDVKLGIEEARYQVRVAALQPFAIDSDRALATVAPRGDT
jgi:hypothetical protein